MHEWPPRENPVQTRNVSRANPASIVLLSHVRLHSLRAFADGFESGADCRTQSKIRKITIAVVSILISACVKCLSSRLTSKLGANDGERRLYGGRPGRRHRSPGCTRSCPCAPCRRSRVNLPIGLEDFWVRGAVRLESRPGHDGLTSGV